MEALIPSKKLLLQSQLIHSLFEYTWMDISIISLFLLFFSIKDKPKSLQKEFKEEEKGK